ncbi:hypothetical protein FAIPA1_340016 [Frankia sp. AiPs1]
MDGAPYRPALTGENGSARALARLATGRSAADLAVADRVVSGLVARGGRPGLHALVRRWVDEPGETRVCRGPRRAGWMVGWPATGQLRALVTDIAHPNAAEVAAVAVHLRPPSQADVRHSGGALSTIRRQAVRRGRSLHAVHGVPSHRSA